MDFSKVYRLARAGTYGEYKPYRGIALSALERAAGRQFSDIELRQALAAPIVKTGPKNRQHQLEQRARARGPLVAARDSEWLAHYPDLEIPPTNLL
jgi:hypothetical protein